MPHGSVDPTPNPTQPYKTYNPVQNPKPIHASSHDSTPSRRRRPIHLTCRSVIDHHDTHSSPASNRWRPSLSISPTATFSLSPINSRAADRKPLIGLTNGGDHCLATPLRHRLSWIFSLLSLCRSHCYRIWYITGGVVAKITKAVTAMTTANRESEASTTKTTNTPEHYGEQTHISDFYSHLSL